MEEGKGGKEQSASPSWDREWVNVLNFEWNHPAPLVCEDSEEEMLVIHTRTCLQACLGVSSHWEKVAQMEFKNRMDEATNQRKKVGVLQRQQYVFILPNWERKK